MKPQLLFFVGILVVLLIVSSLVVICSSRSAFPEAPPPALIGRDAVIFEKAYEYTDSVRRFSTSARNDSGPTDTALALMRAGGEPRTARQHILIAQAYQVDQDFRPAVQHLKTAIRLDRDLADPHQVLGRIYYELALMDMIVRSCYEISEEGFVLFRPDAINREMLALAIAELDQGLTMPKSLSRQEGSTTIYTVDPMTLARVRNRAGTYLAGGPEYVVFSEDQAKVAIWILNSQAQPRSIEVSSGILKAVQLRAGGIPVSVSFRVQNTPFDWAIGARQSELSILDFQGPQTRVPIRRELQATVELAWLVCAWMFICAALEHGSGELDGSESVVAEVTQRILSSAAAIEINLDDRAAKALARGDFLDRYPIDQIDIMMRQRWRNSPAILDVYSSSFLRFTLLTGLAVLPREEWTAKWPGELWRNLGRRVAHAGVPDAEKELQDIEGRLKRAAERGDRAATRESMQALHEICDRAYRLSLGINEDDAGLRSSPQP